MTKTPRRAVGLRQFLGLEQQCEWIDGRTVLRDSTERSESLEQRFRYVVRFEKLLRRPQAQQVLDIVGLYGRNCIPIPRKTERTYWSVSCLPSTSDKPLVRVNANWMKLFTIYADGEDPSPSLRTGIRARFIVHLSDFTTDRSTAPGHLDQALLEQSVEKPEDVGHSLPRGEDMLIINVRGSASIRKFLADPRALRGIRTFNLTHMNRGRNAYQASHCYSVADYMLAD